MPQEKDKEEGGDVPRVAFFCDLDNINIPLRSRGYEVNWENIKKIIEKKYGKLVFFKLFLPYYSSFAEGGEYKNLESFIPHAEVVKTSEDIKEKNVTDRKMEVVARVLLRDLSRPDVMIIASGDNYFCDLADDFERAGTKVVIMSSEFRHTSQRLGSTYRGQEREQIFLMQYMFDNEDLPTNLVKRKQSYRLYEGEFKKLNDLLADPDKSSLLEKNHDSIFQLLSLGFYLAAISDQGFDWKALEKELYDLQKSFGIARSGMECQLAMEMLAGKYMVNPEDAAIKRNYTTWLWEVDTQSTLSKIILENI